MRANRSRREWTSGSRSRSSSGALVGAQLVARDRGGGGDAGLAAGGRARRSIDPLILLVVLLGLTSCNPEIPFTIGPVPETELAGTFSAIDRSQILVPAVSNLSGGVFWPFVNLWSGNFVLWYPVLQVQAVGPDWGFQLFYNSQLAAEVTTLGPGWRHSYEIALRIGEPSPNSITVRWGDGRSDVFVDDGLGWSPAPALHGRRIVQGNDGYTLNTKHGFIYAFDLQGQLIALRDRNGNTMALAYDPNGRLAQMTDATGRTCQLSYDAQGRLQSLSGLGVAPIATFEFEVGHLVRVRDRAGNATEFRYGATQVLVSVTDADGDGIAVEHHPSLTGVTARVITTDGAERRFAYDLGNLETRVIDAIAPGEESEARYRFDANARCIGVTDGPLGTTANSYDTANNLVTHTDADGHTTAMTYNAVGDLRSLTDAVGATVNIAYDPTYHLVVSLVDQAGNTWSGQRDGNGNLTAWMNPLGHQDLFTYNPQGQMTGHSDKRGNVTTMGYDVDGNLTSVTDAGGFNVSAIYNPRGIPVAITDQEGNTAAIALNTRDEPVMITLPGGEVYSLTWGDSRLLLSVEDPRGAVVSWQYNDRKQVVSTTDALGFTSSLVRDGAGRVVRTVNALGNAEELQRDLAGRILSVIDADGGIRSLVWGCCDLLSRTDAFGTMNYQYSPRHELTGAQSSDGTVALTYGWDPRGLLMSADLSAPPDPAISYSFGHDAAGRRTSMTAHHLMNRVATFTLDPEGNATQLMSNQDPAPVAYTFDNRNLCQAVSAGSTPLVANLGYTPRGQIAQLIYSSGVAGAYTYDPNGQLTAIFYQGSDFVADYRAGYDPSGNRTGVDANLPPPIGQVNVQMVYDLRGQPVTLDQPGGQTSIMYNEVRDRASLLGPSGQVVYAYTAAQRMVGAGATTLQWNAAGACVQVADPATTTTFGYRADGALRQIGRFDQAWQVTVGPLGEMARVVLPDGAERWYVHDAADRGLLRRGTAPAPGAAIDNMFISVAADTRWYAGPATLVPEGFPGPAFLPPIWMDLRQATPLLWIKRPESDVNRRAVLADPWGSVTVVADGGGSLLQARAFGLFGEPLTQASPEHLPQGFLGMEAVEGLDPRLVLLSGEITAPYLPETGGFLRDVGLGTDGLFAGGTRGPASVSAPWLITMVPPQDPQDSWHVGWGPERYTRGYFPYETETAERPQDPQPLWHVGWGPEYPRAVPPSQLYWTLGTRLPIGGDPLGEDPIVCNSCLWHRAYASRVPRICARGCAPYQPQ